MIQWQLKTKTENQKWCLKVQILNPYSLHEGSKAPKKDKQRPNLSLVSNAIKTQKKKKKKKKINFINKVTLALFNLKTKNQGRKKKKKEKKKGRHNQ